MNKIITSLIILCSISIYGQVTFPIDETTKRAVFTEVVQLNSVGTESIYNRAKLFVANNYNSAKSVTDLSDHKLHSIVIKAYIKTHFKSWAGVYPAGGFNYTLKIYCKDGRYKYEITDLIHTGIYDTVNKSSGGPIENNKPNGGTFNTTKKQWDYMRKDCVSNIEELITTLKKSMSNPSEIENKDW